MDLNEAIVVHQQWKTRLNQFLGGNGSEALDPAAAGRDDRCELGAWLHGPGKREYASLPEFTQLASAHAAFHRCAGEVVMRSLTGDKVGARTILDGAFHDFSKETAAAITHLKRITHKTHV
jgi:hypothetical protein